MLSEFNDSVAEFVGISQNLTLLGYLLSYFGRDFWDIYRAAQERI